jgi:hypothetical protein
VPLDIADRIYTGYSTSTNTLTTVPTQATAQEEHRIVRVRSQHFVITSHLDWSMLVQLDQLEVSRTGVRRSENCGLIQTRSDHPHAVVDPLPDAPLLPICYTHVNTIVFVPVFVCAYVGCPKPGECCSRPFPWHAPLHSLLAPITPSVEVPALASRILATHGLACGLTCVQDAVDLELSGVPVTA